MRDAELEFGLLTVEVIPASCSNVAADVPPPAVDAVDGEVAVCRFRVIGTRVSLSMDSEKDSGRLANDDVGVGRCEGEVVL